MFYDFWPLADFTQLASVKNVKWVFKKKEKEAVGTLNEEGKITRWYEILLPRGSARDMLPADGEEVCVLVLAHQEAGNTFSHQIYPSGLTLRPLLSHGEPPADHCSDSRRFHDRRGGRILWSFFLMVTRGGGAICIQRHILIRLNAPGIGARYAR